MKLALLGPSVLALVNSASAYTYGLGTSWSIGTNSSSSISKVTTVLHAGTPPSEQPGELILWPGLSNGTGDLLLTSLESWPDQSWCSGTEGQWCIRTSVFGNRKSTDGNYAPVDAGQPVTLTFERNADKSGWTQTASVNGKVVSELATTSGPMTIYGVSTECDDYCAMTVAPQTYIDTTIELESADPSWGTTTQIGSKVYGDGTTDTTTQKPTVVQGVSSSEGGKVWSIEAIIIPQLD